MTETQAPSAPSTTPARATGGAAAWTSWHLHLQSTARSTHDRVLLDVVGPTVRSVPHRPWFFVRYWQAGPHLRLRISDLTEAELSDVDSSLRDRLAVAGTVDAGEPTVDPETYRSSAAALAAAGEMDGPMTVADLLPAGVYRTVYTPEINRYGGAAVMADSERLFHLSSDLALEFLRSAPTTAARARLAARVAVCAAAAQGGPAEQRSYYQRGARMWRSLVLGYGFTDQHLDGLNAAVRDAVAVKRHAARRDSPAGGTPIGAGAPVEPSAPGAAAGALQPMHGAMVELVDILRRNSFLEPGRVLFSHVHMLHNRLGLTAVQELQTYLWLAHSCAGDEPDRPAGRRRSVAQASGVDR